MDYAMISKIEKAKIYSEERHRIQFHSFTVSVQGDSRVHMVQYNQGEWTCDCEYFFSRGYCSHTMAVERVLGEMLPALSAQQDTKRMTSDYALIGKIEKAKIYAEERHRIQFQSFTVTVQGDSSAHVVQYNQGEWTCDCEYFGTRGYCSHTMAIERVLGETLPVVSS